MESCSIRLASPCHKATRPLRMAPRAASSYLLRAALSLRTPALTLPPRYTTTSCTAAGSPTRRDRAVGAVRGALQAAAPEALPGLAAKAAQRLEPAVWRVRAIRAIAAERAAEMLRRTAAR